MESGESDQVRYSISASGDIQSPESDPGAPTVDDKADFEISGSREWII